MKRLLVFVLLYVFIAIPALAAGNSVEKWKRFELVLDGPAGGNPYTSIVLTAAFTNGLTTLQVTGFYDGGGKYKIRFMPQETGVWKYTTASNNKALSNQKGELTCIAPAAGNHGTVKVWDTYNFRYADGKTYYPFGTTVYALMHQGKELETQTMHTLAASPFNKLRMCVFPKNYAYCINEPERFPYKQLSAARKQDGGIAYTWDFKQFNPAFFQYLEARIDELDSMGIETDLIVFHPYDKGRWGFDSMGRENDLLYVKYLAARLSSFKNIWWSMANEFDFVKSKTNDDWDAYARALTDNDPYHHLCSIHNGSVYPDYSKSYYTHASIQNGSAVQDFGRANLLRDAFFKPVVYDEVCYEGNLPLRWGRLSGQELTEACWQGVIAGTYVTHGETFGKMGDTIFWARGGKLVGQSPERIRFLRTLQESGPGPLHIADEWKDEQTSQHDSSYYIIYFGKQLQHEWTFSIPRKNGAAAGARYKADLIDTWDMTITPVDEIFELSEARDYRMFDKENKKIRLPLKPYLAIRLIQVK